MKTKWILDIGAFRGEDAEFYLLKGFIVLSVEANPASAQAALARNEAAAAEGRYRVVNAALDSRNGDITFHVHEKGDWSTAIPNERFTADNSKAITVPAITPAELFDAYGVPYYVKIDIEGKDAIVIDEIVRRADKPRYISYELGKSTKDVANLLRTAGYSRFAISPQGNLGALRMARPPREGKFVDYRFTGHHSGPFGREVPGEWLTLGELEAAVAALDRGAGLARWWDVHACLDGEEPGGSERYLRENFGSTPITRWEAPAPVRTTPSRPTSDPRLEAAIRDVGKDWKRARYYDDAEAAMDRQWSTMIWPCIRFCAFDDVIDLACGHGRNTAKLAEISGKVIAIDVNRENIDFCVERFRNTPNVDARVSDGKSFPGVGSESISLVYCFDAMVHFDSDVVRAYLKEIYRVLRVGGHAFLHHSAMDSNPAGSFRDTPGWRNFMTPALMTHWAHKEGLSVVNQVPVDWRHDGTIRDCFSFIKKWK
jgi:FkbM family methyltransferase